MIKAKSLSDYSVLLLFTILFISQYFSHAQTVWTKHPSNPVIAKGASSWEAIAIGQPTCLFENDTIKMWYVAVGTDMKARISYAWSFDGMAWEKYDNATPVLDVGADGTWDDHWLDASEIVKGPDGYLMYYYGDTAQQGPEVSSAYGLATSPDGINWTRPVAGPVFEKGDSAEWDGKWIESPAVLYDEASATYMMWYTGMGWNWLASIGLATSPDGITWTRYPGNPVIEPGPPGSYDDMWAAVPAVIKTGDLYEMWYCGFPSQGGFDSLRIGYATSPDGISWTKHPDNPVYDRHYPPYDTLNDNDGPWAPDVMYNPSAHEYLMWYEGTSGVQLARSQKNMEPVTDTAKQWSVVYGDCSANLWTKYYRFSQDTLIDTFFYKTLLVSEDSLSAFWATACYIREDGRKVYKRNVAGTEDILLYDFTASAGDTVLVNVGIEAVVLDVGDTIFAGHQRRVQYISAFTGDYCSEIWYEGIGSSQGLIESGFSGMVGGTSQLLCFSQNDSLLYSNPDYNNQCWIHYIFYGIPENSRSESILVYPNPSDGKICFRFQEQMEAICMVITDSYSRQIFRIDNLHGSEFVLDCSGYDSGVYFFRILASSGHVTSGKLIIILKTG
ncbi:MAG: hypothetical protein KJ607_00435 [Bacteroidetes bacterium]|nr:hypothetical protein [Bacteroidota bacterium]